GGGARKPRVPQGKGFGPSSHTGTPSNLEQRTIWSPAPPSRAVHDRERVAEAECVGEPSPSPGARAGRRSHRGGVIEWTINQGYVGGASPLLEAVKSDILQ